MKHYPIYEMLTEGRDAPLYYVTSYGRFQDMMKSDEVVATDSHYFSDRDQTLQGVSLTRDLRAAKRGGKVILELDQRKLAQNHKIVPFDAYAGGGRASRRNSEEFVIGRVKPLSKLITKIHMSKYDHKNFVKDYDDSFPYDVKEY